LRIMSYSNLLNSPYLVAGMEWFPRLIPSISRELPEPLQQAWGRFPTRPDHDDVAGLLVWWVIGSEIPLPCPHAVAAAVRVIRGPLQCFTGVHCRPLHAPAFWGKCKRIFGVFQTSSGRGSDLCHVLTNHLWPGSHLAGLGIGDATAPVKLGTMRVFIIPSTTSRYQHIGSVYTK
jgi:hypothetical protein